MLQKLRRCIGGVIVSSSLLLSAPVTAGPILFDLFYEFGFFEIGTDAVGCDPADPLGAFCFPSSGTPTQFLDAPPWTFVAPTLGATLTVVDAFTSGDQFEVFDFGVSLGLTSAPLINSDCGDDPIPCLADASMSRGIFALEAGAHSITLRPVLALEGGGSGYLQVVQQVAEPTSVALLLSGILALYGSRRRARRKMGVIH